MFNRKILLGSVCALVLGAAGPALADGMGDMTGFSGTLSADYGNTHISGGGGTIDSWGGNAEGMMPLGSTGANLQVDGGYHNLNYHGYGSADVWNINGSLFALINNGGRLGATIGYNDINASGSAHETNYGIFGDWWASDDITASGKVGAFDGTLFNSGYYAGAQGKYYLMPDLGLSAGIDYAHLNGGYNDTDYTLAGEYLLSETTPISITGGWTYSDASGGGGHAQTWFVSLKLYCNGDSNAATLVDRQRTSGTLGYDVGPSTLLARF